LFDSLLAKHAAFSNHRQVNFRQKIIDRQQLPKWRAALRAAGKQLVVTNGCFDLLHVGHVTYLEQARRLGDVLLVGLNGDDGVRQLKGPERPINAQEDRAAVLAALESVTAVCIFDEPTATHFLSEARPDIYVKGGDYSLQTVNQEERAAVEKLGGRIQFIPVFPGKSTTALLKKISRL
jgi:rfaE bifunctional protein nucleotidyltransferase chain/domain